LTIAPSIVASAEPKVVTSGRKPPRRSFAVFERLETAQVDTHDTVSLDQDHHGAAAVSAPDDVPGPRR
jgi:hypothetical protein